MSKNPLIAYFDQFLPLIPDEQAALLARAQHRRVRRRQFLLQEGDVCQRYTFVVEGICKMYYVDQKGNEHNLQFTAENDWIVDIGSFHSQQPSKLYIEAITAGEVLQIPREDLLHLYVTYPKFDRNFRVITENKFVLLQNRLLQNISATATERYQYFVEEYPELSHRLPNTQVASYLGITPEFLSKIRKELSSK